MEDGRMKKVLSKLNEALGLATDTKDIFKLCSLRDKTEAAIEANPKPAKEKWLTTAEAAEIVKLSPKQVVAHIYNGHIKAQKTTTSGGLSRWHVTRTALVDAYGLEFIQRSRTSTIRPKFFRRCSPEDIANQLTTGALTHGYISKDKVISRLQERVSELTSENMAITERNRALISEVQDQINKDI